MFDFDASAQGALECSCLLAGLAATFLYEIGRGEEKKKCLEESEQAKTPIYFDASHVNRGRLMRQMDSE